MTESTKPRQDVLLTKVGQARDKALSAGWEPGRRGKGRPPNISGDNQRGARAVLMLRQFPGKRDLTIFEAMATAGLVHCSADTLRSLVRTHYAALAVRCGRMSHHRMQLVPQHRPCPGCAYCKTDYEPDAELMQTAGWGSSDYASALTSMRNNGMPSKKKAG